MPNFSQVSVDRLSSCHSDLQAVFNEVIKYFDCIVLEGHRGKEAQDKAFADGKSKLQWPNGRHNTIPSLAVDVAPYPVDWSDRERFIYFAGFSEGIANGMGIHLRWGGDWGMDRDLKNNKFDDLVHFELTNL